MPDLEQPPQLDPESARFRLFDSLTTFLKNAAQTQPLMLALDDLHWADKSSLLVLEFLVRELGASKLLVIGTYRDVELSRQHPLSGSLAQMSRESTFQRVLLRGLARSDTGRLIEGASGITPSQPLADVIYTQTEGNPFFIHEVANLLEQEGGIDGRQEGRGIRIPEGVKEAIGRRLNRLSEECNELLTLAAISGREFSYALLEGLTEHDDERLLALVEEAKRRGRSPVERFDPRDQAN